MAFERLDKLIEKINDLSFLSINRSQDAASWENVYRKKVLFMLEYYQKKKGVEYSKKIGLEISVGVKQAMENYRMEQGVPFLFFAKKIINNEISKLWKTENSTGIKISTAREKLFREIKRAVGQINQHKGFASIDLNHITNEQICLIARELNEREYKILEALQANRQKTAKNNTLKDEDGEEMDVIENIADDRLNVEEEKIRELRIREYFECMERVYGEQREKTKPILSMLIVSEILLKIDEFGEGEIGRWIRKLKCVNDKLLLACKHRRVECIEQKKIAEYFQTSEPNITQIWKRFKNKVEEEIIRIRSED